MAKKYCTPDQVKDMSVGIVFQDLGLDAADKFDSFITSLIDRASRYIDTLTNRPEDFFYGGSTVTEKIDGKADSSGYSYSDTERAIGIEVQRRTYYLMHQPIISVTSIHKNTASIGATDVWSEITKYRLNTSAGRVIISNTQAPVEGIDNVRFIYIAGYAAVPSNIRFACEELVCNQLKMLVQQGMASKVRFVQPTLVEWSNQNVLTQSVKEKLAPYTMRRL
jgi:hypothetical protein